MHADPESAKINNLTVFFALSGSARVQAVRKTLMKLTPGRFLWFLRGKERKKSVFLFVFCAN